MKAINKAICLVFLASWASALLASDPNCGDNRETLIVGSDFSGDLGFPPFEVPTEAPANLVGFDIEVACQIRHRLGFQDLEFVQIPYDELIDQLSSEGQQFNLALSAISITNPRLGGANTAFVKYNDDSLGVLFSNEFLANQPATVRESLLDPEMTLEELDALAARVAITVGSRQVDILAESYPNTVPVSFENVTLAINAINSGAADAPVALFTDGPTAPSLAVTNSTAFASVENVVADINDQTDSQGLGIWVSTQCCQLYADVAQAIQDMEDDGTLARLRDEFNVGTFTPVDLTPQACRGVNSDILSNDISNFIFSKYCPCEADVSID